MVNIVGAEDVHQRGALRSHSRPWDGCAPAVSERPYGRATAPPAAAAAEDEGGKRRAGRDPPLRQMITECGFAENGNFIQTKVRAGAVFESPYGKPWSTPDQDGGRAPVPAPVLRRNAAAHGWPPYWVRCGFA